ncbi:MAG TPA: prepilin-type N-terminal cleavage/methylation domain-containing protein [Thermodesulfobacteriota bacterium]|nr:prepilin-type N-terminal cleavage/methylation domain-containing protein [Thermodesulfobacteriota bacterium]
MNLIRNREEGLTLVEILAVVAVMGVVIAIAGSISGEFAERRSVDRVTTAISSTLYISKLRAMRQGLEYQTILTYDPVGRTLAIVTQRGDSNKKSNNYVELTSQTIKVRQGITVTPLNKTYNFNPNGTLGGSSGTVTIRPEDGARINRCGRITVSPFGRIRVIQGNWNKGNSVCQPIN